MSVTGGWRMEMKCEALKIRSRLETVYRVLLKRPAPSNNMKWQIRTNQLGPSRRFPLV